MIAKSTKYTRRFRARHPERDKEHLRKYKAENRDVLALKSRLLYAEKREEILAKRREAYAKKKETQQCATDCVPAQVADVPTKFSTENATANAN